MATQEAIAEYRNQAWDFLARSRSYLAVGDLHQASEKGWGAAAWMAKAVAEAHDWEYESHSQFNVVLRRVVREMPDNLEADASRIYALQGVARGLHQNFYTRSDFLDGEEIKANLDNMEELLTLLHPVTE